MSIKDLLEIKPRLQRIHDNAYRGIEMNPITREETVVATGTLNAVLDTLVDNARKRRADAYER